MPRASRYSEIQILDAAAQIIASGGLSAATIGAIGHRLKAPSGSIYHRFPSRNALLGALWLQKAAQFQNRFVSAIDHSDPLTAGLDAALSLPHSVRLDPIGARVLLLHRREDFLSDAWPETMREQAERLGQQVKDAIGSITERLLGQVTSDGRRVITFAILDVPMAAVRRHVIANEPPPEIVDELVSATYDAVIRARLSRPEHET